MGENDAVHQLRGAKISYFYGVGSTKQDVLGFKISMQKFICVEVLQPNTELQTPTLYYGLFQCLALCFALVDYRLEVPICVNNELLGQYYITIIMPSADRKDSLYDTIKGFFSRLITSI